MFDLRYHCIICYLFLHIHVLYVKVNADRNNDICSEPTYSCGNIPPALPESFTLKASRIDKLGKTFTWREEYFDANNERAKLVEIIGGDELNIIFDYASNEVISYTKFHPGAAPSEDEPLADLGCRVENLMESEDYYVLRFRHKYGQGSQSRMYSSNQVLNYGGPHLYAFAGNGTIEERGLFGDYFKGCVYDEDDDRTVDSKFHWIDINYVFDASALQKVPSRMELKGGLYNEKIFEEFDEVYDIVWFDGSKEFPDDTFEIPPLMECQHQVKRSDQLPKLPNFFSTRLEILSTVIDWKGRITKMSYDWQEEIWYDGDSKLVRLDYVPSEQLDFGLDPIPKFGNTPIAAVFDFNTGVAHFTEKTFGRCLMMKIPQKLFLVSKQSLNKDVPELASPSEIFGLENSKLFYKGKYYVRGIWTLAWSGQFDITKDDKSRTMYREFYSSNGGWHEDYDEEEEYEIPIRETHVYDTFEDGQKAKTINEVNYFKFKKSQPHLSYFDISGCLSLYKRRFFLFLLKGDERDKVNENFEAFSESLRRAITKGADIGTPLRVQELEVIFLSNNKLQATFSLLDVPEETKDITIPEKGVDLDTAVKNLQAKFNTGLLEVRFKDKLREEVKVEAEQRSLKEVKGMAEEFIALRSPSTNGIDNGFHLKEIPIRTSHVGHQVMYAPRTIEQESTGYSSGSLAGLAIGMLLIGSGIGIAAMIFWQKRRLRQDNEASRFT